VNAKELDNALMNPDFTIELLQIFARYGLVNEIALRNSMIRKEHHASKASGERNQDFMIRMAKKYFITEKSIDSIIYRSHKHKNFLKGDIDSGCQN